MSITAIVEMLKKLFGLLSIGKKRKIQIQERERTAKIRNKIIEVKQSISVLEQEIRTKMASNLDISKEWAHKTELKKNLVELEEQLTNVEAN